MNSPQDRIIEENAPSTVKEVGIHLFYMKQDIRDVKDLISHQTDNFANRTDLAAVEGRVSQLESYIKYLALGVAAAIGTAVMKVIGIIR